MLIVSLYFYRDWYVPRAQLAKKKMTLGSKYTADVSKMFEEFLLDVPTTWRTSYLAIPKRLIGHFCRLFQWNERIPPVRCRVLQRKLSETGANACGTTLVSVSTLTIHGRKKTHDPLRSIFGNCQSLLFQLTLWVSEQLLGPTAFEPDQEVQVEDLENHLLLSLTTGSTNYSLLATLARPWILKGRRISMIWYPDLWHALQRQQPFAAS